MSFNPERLLAALPVNRLLTTGISVMPTRLPQWRWPAVTTYNGFTAVERIRQWQLGKWLTAGGCLEAPRLCTICKATDSVAAHSEHYFDVLRSVAICARCHGALHRRFTRRSAWMALVSQHVGSGEEWFALLPDQPFDLAAYLIQTAGQVAARIGGQPLFAERPDLLALMPTNFFGDDPIR